MSSLDDLTFLAKNVVGPVKTEYQNRNSLNFFGSQNEWDHLLADTDDRLQREHELAPVYGIIPEGPRSPLIVTFRNLYKDLMETRPDTFEKCMQALDDMDVTLKTVRELHDFVEFSDIDPKDTKAFLADKMRVRDMVRPDLTSQCNVLVLEQQAIARWNGIHQKPRLAAWNDRPFENLIGDSTISHAVRMKSAISGGGWVIGSYGMRKAEKAEGDGWRLVNYGAVNEPGMAVRTVASILAELSAEPRKRLESLIVRSRAVGP